jgi:hypothetical protein
MVSDDTLLSFRQSIVKVCIWHSSCLKFIEVSTTVRRKGPNGPKYMWYFQKAPVGIVRTRASDGPRYAVLRVDLP